MLFFAVINILYSCLLHRPEVLNSDGSIKAWKFSIWNNRQDDERN